MLLFAVGCRQETSSPKTVIAVTNSYLEAAVLDLMGPTSVLRLAEPGTCPGHFDIKPSQIQELSRCKALFRFDFQRSIDQKLKNRIEKGLEVQEITVSGGLCNPETYLETCRETGRFLAAMHLMKKKNVKSRLLSIKKRVDKISLWGKNAVGKANLRGTKVISSIHQSDFCHWLGLNVISKLPSSDRILFTDLEKAIKSAKQSGVKLIISNRPEGRQAADRLAKYLHAKVVVFDNFPDPKEHHGFDHMLRGNIERLIRESGK